MKSKGLTGSRIQGFKGKGKSNKPNKPNEGKGHGAIDL